MLRHLLTASLISLMLLPSLSFAAPRPDKGGCSDHPLLTRMPNYVLDSCVNHEFDRYKFRIPAAKRYGEENVEGRYVELRYRFDTKSGATQPSVLQVVRNYQNAIRQVGGEVLYDDGNHVTTLKVSKGDKETWVSVDSYSNGASITLRIVDRRAMVQQVLGNAAALSEGLRVTGHVAVYGVYFDTGLAVVKPESEPALAEISKLLGADATLKLWVVGHTDATGGFDANTKLSQARAEAVRAALVAKGVAPDRLIAHGVGPLAPVASNLAEEGRAKNRRVELVAQ